MNDPFRGRKVLITGGLGFIGSGLARRLVDEGAQVTVVDSLIPEYGGNRFNLSGYDTRLQCNLSDVRDEHSLRSLIQGQDYLFNLAGQTSHLDSMQNPQTDLDINCKAQLSILECCRRFNPEIRIVFASTRQLYGKPNYLPVDEKHPVAPVDVNGINKLAGEQFHILYHRVYGLRSCALRLTNTIGPGMRIKDARQTFLGIWIRLILEGKPFEVWEGAQLRDFNFLDDAVQAFRLAAVAEGSPGQIYNLGGIERIRLDDLAKALVEANGGKGEFTIKAFPPERKSIDIGDYYADYGKIRSELGWEPKVTLPEALRRTLAYFREHLARYL
jgi:nucleoside-diphosphate-sugar epimerase